MEGNLVLEHHPLSKMIRVYISSELTGKYWVIKFNDLLLAHGMWGLNAAERTKFTSCYLVFLFTLLSWFPGLALQVTRLCYSFFKQLCSDFHQKNGYCFKIFIRNKWTYGGNDLLLDFKMPEPLPFQTICHSLDSQWERTYLRERVLPQLRKYCHSLGMYFNAVDLYSDFPRSAECSEVMYRLESQGILRLALEEVKLCQQMSAGVTFVVNRVQISCH